MKSESRSTLAAVSSRSQAKAETFAKKFNAEKFYAAHDLILADENIDAVYIALPHALHKDFSIKALKAGKAVLCEKPATLNFAEMKEIAAVARAAKLLLTNYTARNSQPSTAKIFLRPTKLTIFTAKLTIL